MKLPKINVPTRKKGRAVVRLPQTAQQSIPIQRIHRDGIWEVGGKYSRTWRFTDINYSVADEEDKRSILILYCALEKALPTDAITKISIVNKRLNPKEFQKEMLLPARMDGQDSYRGEYNCMMMDKATEGNSIIQERYVTVSVERRSIEEARTFFIRVENDLSVNFKRLSSNLYAMGNGERLIVLHDFFRIGEEGNYTFDFDTLARRGQNFKDGICPDSIQFRSNYFDLGDSKVGRVLFLKEYPSYLEDGFLKELTDLSRNLIVSIDIQPVPTDAALKDIQNRSLAVETDITRWQNKQNQNNNFSAIPPMQLTEARNNMREFLDDLTTRDQRMTLCVMTLVHIADSKEQLDADTDTIQSIASGRNCDLSVLTYQQEDGLNTVLPYGLRKIDTLRTLTTESAAALVPFSSQEIRHRGGVYYGVNATSHNLIVCDRKSLMNGGGFIVGVSGSGKSMSAKGELVSIALSTDDDIIAVDPDGEYVSLIEALGGAVLDFSAGGKNHLNAMDINADYAGGDDPILLKSEFIMSLYDQMMGKSTLGPQEKSIIDRCVSQTCGKYLQNPEGQSPTLIDLHKTLLEQPEEQAKNLALALELFSTGNLNIFAHQTNVDVSNRILCFDILKLGKQLKPVGMSVVLDAIVNRVTSNRQKGRRTWILIDEIRVFFDSEYASSFLERSWLNFRKYGGLPTGLIQNAEKCLTNETARFLFGNSEFLMILKQSPADLDLLTPLLGISQEQANYVRNPEPGCGLIKVGGALVPLINQFPTNTALYRLMTTKPSEKFS